ncbi:nucleotidyltransferase domain-containing protein [Arthrobacter sp. A5]|uniref:nucleotidyltransferase domain-containing protein n=1 Tax=Arthrobacter sp. A5 TaxID=576926 RepID=UPI003DA9EAFD
MAEIITDTYGPRPVLEDLLAEVDGIEAAYIYGSWAARRTGTPGPPPNDVDVLVIGSASRSALGDVAAEAGNRLAREVNIHRVTREAWEAAQGPFERTVKSRPMIKLSLGA